MGAAQRRYNMLRIYNECMILNRNLRQGACQASLATICLSQSMKKTKEWVRSFGGSREFYMAIGFDIYCHRELLKKEF